MRAGSSGWPHPRERDYAYARAYKGADGRTVAHGEGGRGRGRKGDTVAVAVMYAIEPTVHDRQVALAGAVMLGDASCRDDTGHEAKGETRIIAYNPWKPA